eukprot:GEMP01043881.1.p1 GENE.GEMP01043881.1~~GEMP01043881.1.p1  ORF type:complete len:392 (+),score=136.20 GEMP01043881.1:71-1246(+)
MTDALTLDQELAELDEEEVEVRGGLTFRAPTEVLPQTARTAELKRRKVEMLRKKKEEMEALRRHKEQEEAQRRLKEQEAKKLKQQQELKKKEEERKRREEEEQRKKMEGGLDQILGQLQENISPAFISVCGIELGPVRLRLLAKALEGNTSCVALDLSRKRLSDQDGIALGGMLETNVFLQKLDLEGNNLGIKTAKALADALCKNQTLRSLNLDGNNLTQSGNDQAGVISLAQSLGKNNALRVLMLPKNHITAQCGDYFCRSMEQNDTITMLDLSANELGVMQLRKVDEIVRKNRDHLSALRRAERRERFALYAEEFRCRQRDMQVEAMRLEVEALEERRLNRMIDRYEEWTKLTEDTNQKLMDAMETKMNEVEERKEAKKGKGKKKGKKK